MFASALAAIVLFAAPGAAEGGDKAQAQAGGEAKPKMVRVCQKIEAAGSAVPKKKCVMQPVKTAASADGAAQNAEANGAEPAKAE